jgi:hypothetical protein
MKSIERPQMVNRCLLFQPGLKAMFMKMLSSGRLQVVKYARQNCQNESMECAPEVDRAPHAVYLPGDGLTDADIGQKIDAMRARQDGEGRSDWRDSPS